MGCQELSSVRKVFACPAPPPGGVGRVPAYNRPPGGPGRCSPMHCNFFNVSGQPCPGLADHGRRHCEELGPQQCDNPK